MARVISFKKKETDCLGSKMLENSVRSLPNLQLDPRNLLWKVSYNVYTSSLTFSGHNMLPHRTCLRLVLWSCYPPPVAFESVNYCTEYWSSLFKGCNSTWNQRTPKYERELWIWHSASPCSISPPGKHSKDFPGKTQVPEPDSDWLNTVRGS